MRKGVVASEVMAAPLCSVSVPSCCVMVLG